MISAPAPDCRATVKWNASLAGWESGVTRTTARTGAADTGTAPKTTWEVARGFTLTRFVSVGSLAGALTLVIVAAVSDVPGVVAVGAVASAIVIIYRHRGNVARLLAGTERRIGQRVLNDGV